MSITNHRGVGQHTKLQNMNKKGVSAALPWIFRVFLTLFVVGFLAFIVQLYIQAEAPKGLAERSILVNKLQYHPALVAQDAVLQQFYPGRIDIAVLQSEYRKDSFASLERKLDEGFLYPHSWQARSATLTHAYFPAPLTYMKSSQALLSPGRFVSGASSSAEFQSPLVFLMKRPEGTLELVAVDVTLLEQRS